ncbi:MAG TPA: exodeoxyribonuclease VII small subunit [Polyangia bacterium]
MNGGPGEPTLQAPSGPGASAASGSSAGEEQRFDELLARLRTLVEKLEGGHIPLEEGLRCFEEGMTLCKRGAEILDRAERRVEILLGNGAEGARTAPFDTGTNARDDHG